MQLFKKYATGKTRKCLKICHERSKIFVSQTFQQIICHQIEQKLFVTNKITL